MMKKINKKIAMELAADPVSLSDVVWDLPTFGSASMRPQEVMLTKTGGKILVRRSGCVTYYYTYEY